MRIRREHKVLPDISMLSNIFAVKRYFVKIFENNFIVNSESEGGGRRSAAVCFLPDKLSVAFVL